MLRTLIALFVVSAAAHAQDVTDSRTFTIRFKPDTALKSQMNRITKQFLWVTTDGGETWKLAEDAGVKAEWLPITGEVIRCRVTVPADGLWAFVPQFGLDSSCTAESPKKGEKPRSYTEVRVDSSRPGGLSWLDPKKGETWEGGQSVQLRWTTLQGDWKKQSGMLQYQIEGGAWSLITKGVEPADFYFWTVPNTATNTLKIKITATTRAGVESEAASPAVIVVVKERADIAAAKARRDRARVLQAQARFAQASFEYEKALAAWPDYPEALNDLGVVYAEQNQFAKALEFFLRARKASPSEAHPYVNAADMEFRLGLVEDALADMKDAVALDKIDEDPRLALQAGELLWAIAKLRADADEPVLAGAACELILQIRQAGRDARKKAEEFLGRSKKP